MTVTLLKITGKLVHGMSLILECLSVWVCLRFPRDPKLLARKPQKSCCALRTWRQKKYDITVSRDDRRSMTSLCVTWWQKKYDITVCHVMTGEIWCHCVTASDINPNDLVEVVSARSLHCRVTVFLFLSNKCLIRCYVILTKVSSASGEDN